MIVIRDDERQPEDEGADADADRVDGGDDRLGLDIGADRVEPVAEGRVDPVDDLVRQQPDEPVPDPAAIGEEEESSRARARGDAEARHRTTGGRAPPRICWEFSLPGLRLVEVLGDVDVGAGERTLFEPVLDLLEGGETLSRSSPNPVTTWARRRRRWR